MHPLDMLEEAFLVVDDEHVAQVASHRVGLLLDDWGLGLGLTLLIRRPLLGLHPG